MAEKVGINGVLYEAQEARISVFDRGFLYGDSVYEVMRTYGGRLFAAPQHFKRLRASAQGLCIPLPDEDLLLRWIQEAIAAAANEETYLRLMVTRGSGPLSLDPLQAVGPQTIIMARPFHPFPEWMYERGIQVVISAVTRNLKSALDPAIKSGNYLNSILALADARRRKADDAIFLDHTGRVTESTSSNVFWIDGGVLKTAPLATGLLDGVTRGLLLDVARQEGIGIVEQDGTAKDLEAAQELFLSSTLKEVMPVVGLDGKPVGDGRPGPLTRRLARVFHEHALAMVAL